MPPLMTATLFTDLPVTEQRAGLLLADALRQARCPCPRTSCYCSAPCPVTAAYAMPHMDANMTLSSLVMAGDLRQHPRSANRMAAGGRDVARVPRPHRQAAHHRRPPAARPPRRRRGAIPLGARAPTCKHVNECLRRSGEEFCRAQANAARVYDVEQVNCSQRAAIWECVWCPSVCHHLTSHDGHRSP